MQNIPQFSSFNAPSLPKVTPNVDKRRDGWEQKYPIPHIHSFSACTRPEKTSIPMTSLRQKCIESVQNHLRKNPEQADALIESIKDLDAERASQMYQIVRDFAGVKRLAQVPSSASSFTAPSAPKIIADVPETRKGWEQKHPTPQYLSFSAYTRPEKTSMPMPSLREKYIEQIVSDFTGERFAQVPRAISFSAPSKPVETENEGKTAEGWTSKYPVPSFLSFVAPTIPQSV